MGFILLSFYDEYKADVHEIVGAIAQIVQNLSQIGFGAYDGIPILVQNHLTDLTFGEVKQEIRRVGFKYYLILFGKAVQDLTADFLKLRMKENLRILYDNQAGDSSGFGNVGFQKRQHVDASHAFSHKLYWFHGPGLWVKGGDLQGEKLIDIIIQGKMNLLKSSVFSEIVIELFGKITEIQLINFRFQKTGRFCRSQLFWFFLVN